MGRGTSPEDRYRPIPYKVRHGAGGDCHGNARHELQPDVVPGGRTAVEQREHRLCGVSRRCGGVARRPHRDRARAAEHALRRRCGGWRGGRADAPGRRRRFVERRGGGRLVRHGAGHAERRGHPGCLGVQCMGAGRAHGQPAAQQCLHRHQLRAAPRPADEFRADARRDVARLRRPVRVARRSVHQRPGQSGSRAKPARHRVRRLHRFAGLDGSRHSRRPGPAVRSDNPTPGQPTQITW